MKKAYTLTAVFFMIVLLAAGIGAQGKRGKLNDRSRNYDPATVETVKGKVVSVDRTGRRGIHLTVNSGKETIAVHLGPEWFIGEKLKIAAGDQITVVGSRIMYGGKSAIIAKSVTKGGITLQLRNDSGIPLWAGKGRRQNRK